MNWTRDVKGTCYLDYKTLVTEAEQRKVHAIVGQSAVWEDMNGGAITYQKNNFMLQRVGLPVF